MRKYLLYIGLFFIVSAAVFLACSKQESVPDSDPNVIHITAAGFSKASFSIASGAAVTWINDDNEKHTVTTDDGRIDSGDIPAGQSFTFTFVQPGIYNYSCKYHPALKATINVTGIR